MQEDIRSASEITAAEAVKQTAYARKTEQNTNATARAARASARINYANYLNNRRK